MNELIINILSGLFGASMTYLMIKPNPNFVIIEKNDIQEFADLYFDVDIDDAKLLNI